MYESSCTVIRTWVHAKQQGSPHTLGKLYLHIEQATWENALLLMVESIRNPRMQNKYSF